MSRYYDIKEDIKKFPNAWAYFIIGGRGLGKTYSTLKMEYEEKEDNDFIFCKRTLEDVDNMCSGFGKARKKNEDGIEFDLNPFSSINRDTGSRVTAAGIRSGIGGFWEQTPDGEISGKPLGMIFALNGVTKYKGFDLASSKKEQHIIFDEFVPNVYDRVNRNEGLQMLDFYMTVSRDRVQRGLNEVKLICLSNSTMINAPLFDTLEIIDDVSKMQTDLEATGKEQIKYLEDKGIFIHLLKMSDEYRAEVEKMGIYKATINTDWGRMSFDNVFAYNDFSNIEKKQLKNFQPVCTFIYKSNVWYLYKKEGFYYMTESRHGSNRIYNLNKETEQKKAWVDIIFDLRERLVENKMRCENYSMYDLITNYRKIFKLI